MTHDPRSQPQAAAIEQLEAFRLSTYAARTFVALSSLGSATAKEVSQTADVPRTRVYDAVEELRDRGLATVHQSNPQRFLAASTETTRRKLEADVQHRLSVLTTALDRLEPADRLPEQRDIRTVRGKDAIVDRLLALIAEADEEIVYVTDDESLSEPLIEGLSAAADRGLSIAVGGVSSDRFDRLRAAVPNVGRFDDVPSRLSISRFLLVDGSKALLSTQTRNQSPDTETAIWGVGETNSLVAILKWMFGLDSASVDDQ